VRRIGHVPALDGLRGLALFGVLLFHADGALTGGYLGVDLFFVLSGYLITSILLAEHEDAGRIDLKEFWIRRARRLFPALLALMPAVAILARWVAKPVAVVAIRWDALATLGYVANWRAVFSHKSYWELFTSTSPLEHTWSLSIEEQFYVVWPIVVVLVLRFSNRRALLGITIASAVASMVAMVLLFDPEATTRAYYGTDTRAAAILAGAALAMVLPQGIVLSKTKAWLLEGLGFIALAVLGWAWWTIDGNDTFLYHGGFWLTELASVALIACGVANPSGALARIVSIPPLRLMGLVSYGAYLWHWPINVLFTADRTHVHGLALQALRLGTTFAVSAISYRFLEQPIRKHGVPFGRAIWVVPASVAVAIGVVALGTMRRPIPPVSPPVVQGVTIRFRIRMIGDSTAASLGWALRGVAGQDVAIDLRHQDGLNMIYADDVTWPKDEPRSDATLVVLGGAFLYGIRVDGKWTKACHPKWDRLFEEGLDQHLAQLEDASGRVWIVTSPYPLGPYDNASYRKEVDCINASTRKIAAKRGIARIIDVNEMLCPKGECQRELGGVSIRPDGVHYDIEGARGLAQGVMEQVDPGWTNRARDL
jgi:peptidoglycan/LPS O-acetylase OafA/YrhL